MYTRDRRRKAGVMDLHIITYIERGCLRLGRLFGARVLDLVQSRTAAVFWLRRYINPWRMTDGLL